MKIEQGQIVETALGLLNEHGLDALNMRAIAKQLNVQASALYWHVADKSELTGLMANGFYARAFEAARPSKTWREWLLVFGAAFRRELLAHRDSARLCANASPGNTNAEQFAAPLVAAGLSRNTALAYQASVISLALGWAVYEQSATMRDHLQAMFNFEDSFALGLTSLVNGFPEPAKD